ncbi:MAG: DUF5011 domain-containing protein [Clostridiales bacterium]|nr:DUF5011 domain-containing protein [Clostridiales bacterium]
MATVTKIVDKTLVNGSETFIYTINVSYSGLSAPAQSGKLVDFFPSKILYQLPQPGGQLVSITQTPVSGGHNVEFNFGNVNAGTSLSFTVACQFGPGRVDNDSFTNKADLYADSTIVATGTAPTVNLKLDENFTLMKVPDITAAVLPGQLITFNLILQNSNDPGAKISNVVVTDVLPPQLIPDTSFTPVGNDKGYFGYPDPTYNGLTGSWSGNTLNFTLPSYSGGGYAITFKATVASNVTPGQLITNTAMWTVNGTSRVNATVTMRVFENQASVFLKKGAPLYAELNKPIQYMVTTTNTGTVPLTNYVLTDTLPPEVNITKISFLSFPSTVPSYSLYVETSELPGTYKTVATNLSGSSIVYDLTPFIPAGKRVLSVRAILSSMTNQNVNTNLYLYGMVNNTATANQVIINTANMTAQSSIGNVTATSSAPTTLNGKSILNVQKNLVPQLSAYYPLNEFIINLIAQGNNGIIVNPTFADLLPLGLDYAPGNDYFSYFDRLQGVSFDSRNPGFPVPPPTTEITKNYEGTGRTLVRFKFNNFILLYQNNLSVNFGVVVTLNPPNSFVNYGYVGNPGNNAQIQGIAFTDAPDLDGDGIENEQIAQSLQTSGTILTTSEFSLEKWVKGNLATAFSKASSTTAGGDIVYNLNVTNNQDMDLKNIEMVDILPYVGDTGVILNTTPRGSQFNVYAAASVTAQIVNILGDPVNPNPVIKIEYSTSNNPVRFDETGTGTIGNGTWSLTPPADITTLASIRVTTDPSVILKPYERLIVTIQAKAPVGVALGKLAYNSYAVRADKVSGGVTSKMNPAEPNKVSVQIGSATQSSIGNFVWLDLNGNGLYDAAEPGVNGVTVELYDPNGTKFADTVTANDSNGNPGYYSFTNLAVGNYYVKFIPYGSYTLTVQQSSVANGSKPNQATGVTDQFTLAQNQILTTINAGVLLPPCSPPLIYASNQCLHLGDRFNPLTGVTATDCQENNITSDVKVISNNVDTTTAGIYYVTYAVTDARGQTTTKTIEVKVCAKSPYDQGITDLFESVALEQTALAHILNAEGEKIQKAKALKLSTEEMIAINGSVKGMTDAVTQLEMVLQGKLELFDCDSCGDNCCKDF